MLPLWYTAVRNANLTGEPVVQPLWFEFPDEEALHTVESEVLVGGALLVAPAIAPRPMAVLVVKPPGKWYSFVDGIELVADANLAVGLSEVPVYIRGGRIVPAYTKSAMTTQEILATPITLHIALDEKGTAVGSLYLDDGETHKFLEGEFLKKTFTFADGVLSSTTTGKVPEQLAAMIIDQLVFYSKEKVARKVDVRLVEEFSVKVDDLEPVLAKSDL
jgi:alpha-glucosidase (family GH31 glycosyl hydrolase)